MNVSIQIYNTLLDLACINEINKPGAIVPTCHNKNKHVMALVVALEQVTLTQPKEHEL